MVSRGHCAGWAYSASQEALCQADLEAIFGGSHLEGAKQGTHSFYASKVPILGRDEWTLVALSPGLGWHGFRLGDPTTPGNYHRLRQWFTLLASPA